VLLEAISSATFAHVTRGLYHRHRLLFAAQLAMRLARARGSLSADDLAALVEPPRVRANTFAPVPVPVALDWVPALAWERVRGLAEVRYIANLMG